MWRSIFAVILLPALTAAQSVPSAGSLQMSAEQTSPKTSVAPRSTPSSSYKPYTYCNGIRRGATEEVAVQLSTGGFATTPKSPVSGIVPLELELEPAEGLTFTEIHYPEPFPRKFDFHPKPIPVAGLSPIRFKVRADDKAELGVHVLRGKLMFQPVHFDSTMEPVQQLDVEIPLTVVEQDAKVGRGAWPFPHTSAGAVILLIVLAPILIALVVLYYTVCAIEGPQNCPD
jgi:hypothetical protein